MSATNDAKISRAIFSATPNDLIMFFYLISVRLNGSASNMLLIARLKLNLSISNERIVELLQDLLFLCKQIS
jgi:hypothetical protein